MFARDSGYTIAGDDDTGEIDGIGGSDRDDGGAFAGASGPKGFYSFGERVLFATKAGYKAAAADLSARFETAQDVEEIAPFGSVGFPGEEIAEEDSVASEELAGEGLEGAVGAASLFDDSRRRVQFFGEKRPAAGGSAGLAAVWSFGAGGFATGVHAGAELVEAIGRGQAGRSEFPERVLDLMAR